MDNYSELGYPQCGLSFLHIVLGPYSKTVLIRQYQFFTIYFLCFLQSISKSRTGLIFDTLLTSWALYSRRYLSKRNNTGYCPVQPLNLDSWQFFYSIKVSMDSVLSLLVWYLMFQRMHAPWSYQPLECIGRKLILFMGEEGFQWHPIITVGIISCKIWCYALLLCFIRVCCFLYLP